MARKKQKKAQYRQHRKKAPAHPSLLQNLLSSLQSPQVPNARVLKDLYYLLIHVSTNAHIKITPSVSGSHNIDVEIYDTRKNGIRVSFSDIISVANTLFEKLFNEFDRLFPNFDQASKEMSDKLKALELMNLLLRCCLVVLVVLMIRPDNYVVRKGQVVLAILQKLISWANVKGKEVGKKKGNLSFEKSVSRVSTFFSDGGCRTSCSDDFVASLRFLEMSDPCVLFVCSMLEVFTDELLVHGQLREFLKRIDSITSANEMLFVPHSSQGEIGIVLEIICHHFSLAFLDEEALLGFFNRLACVQSKELKFSFESPQLSLNSAISLFLNPFIHSAPKLMQAHLISLVTEATSIFLNFRNLKPDERLLNCYLSVFEKSLIMYTMQMSILPMDVCGASSAIILKIFPDTSQSSLDSFLNPETRKKIHSIATKLNCSASSQSRHVFFRIKSNLVNSSLSYIEEIQYVFDTSYSKEILSILSCIILKASDDFDDTAFRAIGDADLQDLCLLASVLKLLGTSLLQSIWFLRHDGNFDRLKTLKDFSSCAEYNFILRLISSMGEFSICFPIQKLLSDIMATCSSKHKNTKMVFGYFCGLLSLSFISGLDALVKACLWTIVALMNLFIFEEGDLDALRPLIASGPESISAVVRLDKARGPPKSCRMVANKFQRMRTIYLSKRGGIGDRRSQIMSSAPDHNGMENDVGMEAEETSSGEIYLKCVLGNASEVDELADFVECAKGKDYSAFLEGRKRYRKWKGEKMAVLRWERKKKVWEVNKGK